MSVLTLTSQNFDKTISEADKTVLVDFWASWCNPCRMMSPLVDSLAKEKADKLIVGKVNVDDEGELAARFGINSIPTLIVFKNGAESGRIIGLQGKPAIEAMIG